MNKKFKTKKTTHNFHVIKKEKKNQSKRNLTFKTTADHNNDCLSTKLYKNIA